MFRYLGHIKDLVIDVVDKWIDDRVPKSSAAVSFYTIFSLTPLMLVLIAIAGFFLGRPEAKAEILQQARDLIGFGAANLINNALENATEGGSGVIATVIGSVAFIVSTTTVFVEIKDTLNTIWGIKPKISNMLLLILVERLKSLLTAIVIGVLFLIILVLSFGLSWTYNYLPEWVDIPINLLPYMNYTITFVFLFLLFSTTYKILPDKNIPFRDVFRGAAVTTTLFLVGKYFIGLYLGTTSYSSVYGAAGSFAVFLIWIYYSAMIFFFGAAFSAVYSKKYKAKFRKKYREQESDNEETGESPQE